MKLTRIIETITNIAHTLGAFGFILWLAAFTLPAPWLTLLLDAAAVNILTAAALYALVLILGAVELACEVRAYLRRRDGALRGAE